MEAIETASAEPDGARLLRGSYDFLAGGAQSDQSAPGIPRHREPTLFSSDQPLLWTPAYEWWTDCEVLIPAEMVFFPLAERELCDQGGVPDVERGESPPTRSYPSAALAGLFECLERMYLGMVDVGRAHLEALHEDQVADFDFARWESLAGGRELQLYAVSLPDGPDLPMVVCLIVGDRDYCLGSACAGDPDSAVRKAIDEALVVFAALTQEDSDRASGDIAGPGRPFGFDPPARAAPALPDPVHGGLPAAVSPARGLARSAGGRSACRAPHGLSPSSASPTSPASGSTFRWSRPW